MTRKEYDKLMAERRDIIGQNAGRRMMRNPLPQLPVPPKPEPPMGWELTEDGDYFGFTKDEQEKDDFLAGGKNRKAKEKESIL